MFLDNKMNYEIPDELCSSKHTKMEELNLQQEVPFPLLQGNFNNFNAYMNF